MNNNGLHIRGHIFRAYISYKLAINIEICHEKLINLLSYLSFKFFNLREAIEFDEISGTCDIKMYPARIELKGDGDNYQLKAVRGMSEDVTWSVVFSIVAWLVLGLVLMAVMLIFNGKYGPDAFDEFVFPYLPVGPIMVAVIFLSFICKYIYSRKKGLRLFLKKFSDFKFSLEMIFKGDVNADHETVIEMVYKLVHPGDVYENPAVIALWDCSENGTSETEKKLSNAMEKVFGERGGISCLGNMIQWKSWGNSFKMRVIAIPRTKRTEIVFTDIFNFDSTVICSFGLPTIWILLVAIGKFIPLILSGKGSYSGAYGLLDYAFFPGIITGIIIAPFLGPVLDKIRFRRRKKSILIKGKMLADILEQQDGQGENSSSCRT